MLDNRMYKSFMHLFSNAAQQIVLALLLSTVGSTCQAVSYCGDFHTWDQYPPYVPSPSMSTARLVIAWDPDTPADKGSFSVTLWTWESVETSQDLFSFERVPASETVHSSPGPANAPPESRAVVASNDSRFQTMFAERYTVRILDKETNDPHAYLGYAHKGDVIYEACEHGNCTSWTAVGNLMAPSAHTGVCPRDIVVRPAPVIYRRIWPAPVYPAPNDSCVQNPAAPGCPRAIPGPLVSGTKTVPDYSNYCWDITLAKWGGCQNPTK